MLSKCIILSVCPMAFSNLWPALDVDIIYGATTRQFLPRKTFPQPAEHHLSHCIQIQKNENWFPKLLLGFVETLKVHWPLAKKKEINPNFVDDFAALFDLFPIAPITVWQNRLPVTYFKNKSLLEMNLNSLEMNLKSL